MAPFLQRYHLEKILYLATSTLLALGTLAYVASFFSTDWAVDDPVLPFYIISAGATALILAVAASAVRLFHADHPEVGELLDPLGMLSDSPAEYAYVRPAQPANTGV